MAGLGRDYHALASSHTHVAPDALPLQTSREMADQTFGGNAVEFFSLVSALALVTVAATVGSRLLLLARRTHKLPELAIGTTCLSMAIGGVLLFPVVFFADSWPGGAILASSILSKSAYAVGASAVCLLTWRVFRPGRAWAASAWAAVSLVLAATVLAQSMRGDATSYFALLPENHVYWWVRIAAFLWTGLESLRYAGMMRRQARLGLGDPVVAAQIRLWGVASMAIGAMMMVWALAPHLGHASGRGWPAGILTANALGLVGAVSLHLAFLSPAAWRRWIAERAAS